MAFPYLGICLFYISTAEPCNSAHGYISRGRFSNAEDHVVGEGVEGSGDDVRSSDALRISTRRETAPGRRSDEWDCF